MPEFVGEFLFGALYGSLVWPAITLLVAAACFGLDTEGATPRSHWRWLWAGVLVIATGTGMLGMTALIMECAKYAGFTLSYHSAYARYGSTMTLGMLLGSATGVWLGSRVAFALAERFLAGARRLRHALRTRQLRPPRRKP